MKAVHVKLLGLILVYNNYLLYSACVSKKQDYVVTLCIMERAENYVNEAIFFTLLYLSAFIFIDDMVLYIESSYVHVQSKFRECVDNSCL